MVFIRLLWEVDTGRSEGMDILSSVYNGMEAFYLERKTLVLKKNLLVVFLTMHIFPSP